MVDAPKPPAVRFESVGGGVRYVMPPGLDARLGARLMLLGAGCTIIGAGGVVLLPGPHLLLLPAGIVLLLIGWFARAGRQVVTLDAQRLRSAWRVGPLRWWRTASIRDIEVVRLTPTRIGVPRVPSPLWWVEATRREGSSLSLVVTFSHPDAAAVTEHLAARLSQADGGQSAGETQIEAVVEHDAAGEPITLPRGSSAVVEEHDGGVTIWFPPDLSLANLWPKNPTGWHVLAMFALLWLAVALLITVSWLADDEPKVVTDAMRLALAWCIGLVLLGGALHWGRRWVVIDAAHGHLLITTSSPFYKWQRDYPAEEIRTITAAGFALEIGLRSGDTGLHQRGGRRSALHRPPSLPRAQPARHPRRQALAIRWRASPCPPPKIPLHRHP